MQVLTFYFWHIGWRRRVVVKRVGFDQWRS